MRKISCLVALAFVLAVIFQLAAVAQAPTTHPAAKGAAKPGVQKVMVREAEYTLTLNPSTVAAGKTRFVIKNNGKMPHQFEIKGKGVDAKTPDIAPGKERQLTVDLKPGKYDVYSPADKDRQKGMHATLTVK